MTNCRRGVASTIVAAMACAVGLAAEPPAPKKITTVMGITEYQLDNGLRVLLFPDSSKPTVTVNVTYFVGSRHEGYGETGMAHLLEHMVFKGTPDHPTVWKSLQDHGASFNGTTSFDRTNYFETMPANDENLEFGLALEADRMVNSFIAKKDLDSEMSVVRNEFEMGENSPVRVLSERIESTAYLWHNYGKSTIGSREDIERVPIDRLQAFYKKFYQPDNAMLVVAGKFDETKTLKRVNELYGTIPRPMRQLEQTYTVEPTQDGEREVTLRRVGDVQAIGCVYHICAGPHEDMPALEVLSNILDTDQTGRLYKAVIEPQLATSVNASAESLHDPGYFEIMAQVRADKSLDDVRTKLFNVMDNLGKQTFTDEEVKRAKASFDRSFDLLLNDSGRVGIRLTEFAAMGDWRLLFLHHDRVMKVTPEDVQRVAAKYFAPSNRTVGVFIPTKSPERSIIPPTPDVASLVKDYNSTQVVAKGEEFEATYANIEAKTKTGTLPNGMKYSFLSKETRGNRVNANLMFRYGSEKDLVGKTDAARMIGTMLMKGTKNLNERQIQDKLAELKAQVRIGGGGGGGGGRFAPRGGGAPGVLDVSIETTRENLPAVLDLVAEILRQPAFPAEEFEKTQKEMLAGLEQQMSEPTMLAGNALQRTLSPYPPTDIRYIPTPQESLDRLKALKLEDVKAVYQQLVGADASQVAFVGDFDQAQVQQMLTKHFGDWKSGKPFERVAGKYQPTKPDRQSINTPDKANAMFTIGMQVEIRDDDPDYAALFMANFMFGGNANSRMMNRIRQKEGLSYGCGANCGVSSQDKQGTFVGYGICAPQNADKAIACAQEELLNFIANGVTQQELDDARAGYHQTISVQLANDGAIAGSLVNNAYLGRTMKFQEDLLKKIDALTPQQVQQTMAKYITPEKLVIIRAGDFKAGEEGDSPATEKQKKHTSG